MQMPGVAAEPLVKAETLEGFWPSGDIGNSIFNFDHARDHAQAVFFVNTFSARRSPRFRSLTRITR